MSKTKAVEPHQQRVLDEYHELSARTDKLQSFFCTQVFASLDESEQRRLDHQFMIMNDYRRILIERIKAMGHLDCIQVAVEMPMYKCHKRVRALKIKEVVCHAHSDPSVSIEEFAKLDEFQGGNLFFEEQGHATRTFTAEWYRKHKPEKGGYFVLYNDGYESYSPAKAFEEGYTRVTV